MSTLEVRIPPITMIGNLQVAQIVPNMKALRSTSEVLPLKEQKEPSEVGQSSCSNSPKNELAWLTPIYLQLELDVPTFKHDVLDKVDLLQCTEWDPKDQQEARNILREYTHIFPFLSNKSVLKNYL